MYDAYVSLRRERGAHVYEKDGKVRLDWSVLAQSGTGPYTFYYNTSSHEVCFGPSNYQNYYLVQFCCGMNLLGNKSYFPTDTDNVHIGIQLYPFIQGRDVIFDKRIGQGYNYYGKYVEAPPVGGRNPSALHVNISDNPSPSVMPFGITMIIAPPPFKVAPSGCYMALYYEIVSPGGDPDVEAELAWATCTVIRTYWGGW